MLTYGSLGTSLAEVPVARQWVDSLTVIQDPVLGFHLYEDHEPASETTTYPITFCILFLTKI